jgi:aryl-alcohol dehydrogenase-like predicted oxidoreductase
MDYVTLGRTGLRVSVAGLGCGGNSRLGLRRGKTEAEAIALVRQALDMGVNLLDTAAPYGTEALIGQAIKAVPRERVVIATKANIHRGGQPIPAPQVVESLDHSLRQLNTDYIDVFQLHVVLPSVYDHALHEIAPVLLREKEKGKFRHLGITETSPNDHEQRMLQRALHDEVWEVMMLGFNMMHQKVLKILASYESLPIEEEKRRELITIVTHHAKHYNVDRLPIEHMDPDFSVS